MKFSGNRRVKLIKEDRAMTTRNHLIISTLACLLVFAAVEGAAQTRKNANASRPRSAAETRAKPRPGAAKAKPPAKGAGAAIFLVTQDRAGAHIAPLVGVIEGRLIEPPSAESDSFSEFASRYYRAGQKYRLLFGGGEAGTATVKSGPDKESECARAQASVELETTARINGLVMGLATASGALGRKTSSRRFPTADERTTVSDMAKGIFRQKGVAAAALENMKTINMTATDLGGDGKAEVIASFIVRTAQKNAAVHHLFLIAAHEANGLDVDLMRYSRTNAGDLPGGASLDDVDQATLTEVLVDQLDLNDDKMAEVITMTTSFEGATYKIYRKQKGQWATVYEFYGYRCAY
jgi:hypothetical protein